jgi:hypothetical protein
VGVLLAGCIDADGGGVAWGGSSNPSRWISLSLQPALSKIFKRSEEREEEGGETSRIVGCEVASLLLTAPEGGVVPLDKAASNSCKVSSSDRLLGALVDLYERVSEWVSQSKHQSLSSPILEFGA